MTPVELTELENLEDAVYEARENLRYYLLDVSLAKEPVDEFQVQLLRDDINEAEYSLYLYQLSDEILVDCD